MRLNIVTGMKNAFHIVANDKLSLNVGALTNFDKYDWIKALQTSIQFSKSRKGELVYNRFWSCIKVHFFCVCVVVDGGREI